MATKQKKKSGFPPPPPPADTPIIVTGGGSIDVDLPTNFKGQGIGSKGNKFKHGIGTLQSLQIDGGTPIPLKPTSTITINCK